MDPKERSIEMLRELRAAHAENARCAENFRVVISSPHAGGIRGDDGRPPPPAGDSPHGGATPTGSGAGGPRADGTPYDPVDGPEGLTGGPIGTARPSTTAVGTLPARDPMERPSWWPDDPTGETIDDGRWRWGEGWVDAHFHLMWEEDWSVAQKISEIEALVELMDADGVAVTVLSATSYDFDTLPDIAQDVDEMVIQGVWQYYMATTPLTGSPMGMVDRVAAFLCGGYCGWLGIEPEAVSYITWAEDQIATYGWFIKGFGELIVHGHGYQHDGGSGFLPNLYRIAGEAGLAVLVHWDIGAVDAYTGDDGTLYCAVLEDGVWTKTDVTVADQCQANFDSFYRVAYENPDATFILAHCGAGPGTSGPYSTDPSKCSPSSGGKKTHYATFDQEDACHPRTDMYDTWEGFLTAILEGTEEMEKLDNVYFDIAGMIGDFDGDSKLVDRLKVFMTKHPHRFLFGMDKTTDLLDTYSTVDGVAEYESRLSDPLVFGLSATAVEQIMRGNAVALLGLPTSA